MLSTASPLELVWTVISALAACFSFGTFLVMTSVWTDARNRQAFNVNAMRLTTMLFRNEAFRFGLTVIFTALGVAACFTPPAVNPQTGLLAEASVVGLVVADIGLLIWTFLDFLTYRHL